MVEPYEQPLRTAAAHALSYLGGVPERAVAATAGREELHALLGGSLPDAGSDPVAVIDRLAAGADPGLVTTQSPRFFGFVIGGAHPAALAADWLTSAWDQNAGLFAISPAAAVAENVAAGWVLDLLRLPPESSVGFVTGGQMAVWTCLAAARHHVLEEVGWDVERDGLQGAPRVHVVVSEEGHGTVDRALRFLGLGAPSARRVDVDAQGRMRADDLGTVLEGLEGPTIVVAQAGNVNTGAVDPLSDICTAARRRGAWVHVDGAFGLWAQASSRRRALTAGIEAADSWSVDAHKWLNVPYDSGIAIVRHPQAHQAAMGSSASYLIHDADVRHDQLNWNPEHSRRARGFATWALLQALGAKGVEALVDDLCDRARRFADALGAVEGIDILNEVVLNQVLVRFTPPEGSGADADAHTRDVVRRVQEEGTCWMSGTTWQGRAAMRISVSNWATTEADVDRSVDAILRCARLDG